MRQLFKATLPVVLLGAASAPQALAADYDPPLVIDEVPQYKPVEIGSGWYLRGDIGYAVKTRSGGNPTYRSFDGTNYYDNEFASGEFGDDFSFGAGFGYHFNDMLRGDLTVERMETDFFGSTVSAAPCPGGPVDTSCRSEDGAEFEAYSVLANAYVDLGTVVGITPYLGAGIGYTYVSWDELNNTTYCVDGAGSCTGFVNFSTPHEGERDWRFTYALMAGVSYDMTKRTKLDLGYRYMHVDGGNMFNWDAGSAAAGASGVQGEDKGFSKHELRVGLRFDLW
ncbi:outer membrane protein [Nitratireductor basaltis]|uniref:Heat resistant agglutinin 1 protein n=1 Tax=Nitratireductor basaltis TaxID=472175 RepID=A0A084U7A4_9HYPH|nr:outer membrane protein [Nitratireductor basaltis]KFB08840.1 Heat resistant agglutinin 1 protein [Nitratireductor basaltis]